MNGACMLFSIIIIFSLNRKTVAKVKPIFQFHESSARGKNLFQSHLMPALK